GLDKDPGAIERVKKKFGGVKDFTAIHGGFEKMKEFLAREGVNAVDGVLFDLGISTEQLKSERGFSFQVDAPLDMRFDSSGGITAADILNESHPEELVRIFSEFGEIRGSRKLVKLIVERRKKRPFVRTGELVELICQSFKRYRRKHPATLFFQALRIAVNDELECLRCGLHQARETLKKSGRLVVISFHSLEDRIVKHFFRQCDDLKVLTPKPERVDRNTVAIHPESRSAKLRVAEKV
ncbi:MAG: 16S rRNA (cytosine(1402)-N(4))-methyltransferase RsmH, partial [Candidatus Omnitrophica bacterium]|nr:16S rRNA (cytosine(1402)-N(4))-methyltransferase RsmH [Candidatus Omnitrophota bacterium]